MSRHLRPLIPLFALGLLGGSSVFAEEPVPAADTTEPVRNEATTPASEQTSAYADDAIPPDDDPPEEVVVSGEQPGPGLWKITRGENVMWVLGMSSPLPKNMVWRSREVEAVLAEAELIVGEQDVSADIGFFRAIRYLRPLLRARFNPDGARLVDLVSPDDYQRWLPLRKKYFKDDPDIEKVRPMFIALGLYSRAIEEAGLTRRTQLDDFIKKLAKKHRIRRKVGEIKVPVKDPKQAIRDFTETPREADVACFVASIGRLEADLDLMRKRANAWAVGDIQALRQLPPSAQQLCFEALISAPGLQDEIATARKLAEDAFLADIDEALTNHRVSFATLGISDLVREDSTTLRLLRERGYTIEEPAN